MKQKPLVEVRSIDYIPRSERHGKVWHQAPFWFTGNFVLTTLATGFTGPALGLSALHSVIAIILGVMLGTFFMAFHANQGPRMGLPQMIQSRAQFGIRGAIFPFAAVVFVYMGFNVFNTILATDAVNTVLPGSRLPWYMLFVSIAILLSIFGHDILHSVQRFMTWLLILCFGLLSVGALSGLQADAELPTAAFSWSAFFAQLAIAAGYQISYSVYVSDYSRYLPYQTKTSQVVFFTYLGAAGSAIWLMSLGAFLASSLPAPADAIGYLQQAGNQLFPGFGTVTVLLCVPALVGIMAVNLYGATLTGISALDGFFKIKPTLKVRVLGIGLIGIIIFTIALSIPDDYLGNFETFVLLMLYFLVPWTAINLVDFYFVRKGHYSIIDIFNPKGIYGLWNKAGITAYLLGVVSMLPFVSLSFYTGILFDWLNEVDISFIIGLAVSGCIYWLMTRKLDIKAELKKEEQSEKELEQV